MNRLKWELLCATEVLNTRRLRGEPIPDELKDYHEEVEADWAAMSGIGRNSCETSEASSTMGVEEVAAMLNRTTRQVRRIAPSLGAERVNGTWIFQRGAVEEFARTRKASA
jgi:hypothetical protein